MALINVTTILEDATQDDILINGKYGNEFYRLVYILKRLVEVNELEQLEVVYLDDPEVKDIKNRYSVSVSIKRTNHKFIDYFSTEKDVIKYIKELIGIYYDRACDARTRILTSTSLAEYWNDMCKMNLNLSKYLRKKK